MRLDSKQIPGRPPVLYLLLGAIFLVALAIRFLYFPQNIYFGFDQARDAFAALEIAGGNFKVVGPPTGVEGWFHGPLYYYLYAPIYYFSVGNPELVAAFLRIINSVAVILAYLAGSVIFNHRVGLFAAFLFAFSFEQTQYALYFNHPSLAVITVLLFYLGLAVLFFKKNPLGLILTLGALGLSIQFEFVLNYLFIPFIFLLIIFRRQMPKFDTNILMFSVAVFILSVATFLLAEIKLNFTSLQSLFRLVAQSQTPGITLTTILGNVYLVSYRLVGDNLFSYSQNNLAQVVLIFLILICGWFIVTKHQMSKIIFLLTWLMAGVIPYIANRSATPLYYYSVGASISLLIFTGFLLDHIWKKSKFASLVLIALLVISNLSLIIRINEKGPIATINVQSGMLLSDEKKVVDYLYQKAAYQSFAVNALSMPLSVNTTWSYLFEWYGKQKYGYLPVWIGPTASGYPGNLTVENARSNLPKQQFLIIEPTRGIREGLIKKFMEEEGYFSKVTDEKKFGAFVVQKREQF